MSEKSIPIAIRVPSDLIERIDYEIEEYQYFTTRPAFILDGIRDLFRYFIDLKGQNEQIFKSAYGDNPTVGYESLKKMMLVSVFQEYYTGEGGYKKYVGASCQIMLRIPAGLYKDINTFIATENLCEDFSVFWKTAILFQLRESKRKRDFIADVEKAIAEDQKMMKSAADAMNSTISDIQKKNALDLLKFFTPFNKGT